MNVAFIGQKGIPAKGGGVERHVDELATRLSALGHNVSVYCREKYTGSTKPTYKGVELRYTRAIYTKNLEAISHTFFSILDLAKRDVDVIHVQMIGPALLIPLIRLIKPKAKIVTTYHSMDYHHQKWGWFAKLMLRLGERITCTFSDEVITVSKNLQKFVWENYQCDAYYIPNGVPLPKLGADPMLLKQWNLEPQEYIVAVTRLIRHKGIHLLIKAYQQLNTDKKLVIVGGSEYTDTYVQELVELAGMNDNIIFTDRQSGETLEALYEHAYLFAMPTLYEGLSIALLEALSYNLPVLASDIPQNMEVIKGLGFTFSSENVHDLTKHLQFLLEHPEITNQYRKTGRDAVHARYNWDTIAKETSSVYAKMVKGKAILRAQKQAKHLG